MEVLITLVLIGMVIYFLPYILAAMMLVVALFAAVIATFVYAVKRITGR